MTTKNKVITEMLPCDLDEDEIRARGQELAKQEQELETLQEERRAAGQGYRDKIKQVRAEIARLANDITRKKEDRKVKVEIRVNDGTGSKSFWRLDTDKRVREEALTTEERQGTLEEVPEEKASA